VPLGLVPREAISALLSCLIAVPMIQHAVTLSLFAHFAPSTGSLAGQVAQSGGLNRGPRTNHVAAICDGCVRYSRVRVLVSQNYNRSVYSATKHTFSKTLVQCLYPPALAPAFTVFSSESLSDTYVYLPENQIRTVSTFVTIGPNADMWLWEN
jgi:hypothetical protein